MDENYFDQCLDEALALVAHGKTIAEAVLMFPAEFQNELAELLAISATVAKDRPALAENAPAAFQKTMAALKTYSPVINSLTTTNMDNSNQPKPRFRFSFRLPRLSYAFIILALVSVAVPNWLNRSRYNQYPVPLGSVSKGGALEAGVASPQSDKMDLVAGQATGLAVSDNPISRGAQAVRSWFPPEPPNPNIDDRREYLKTDYHAVIKTRDLNEVSQHVQTMVRGYSGRVDNSSLSEKYGYVSFVIPKSELENFKAELKTLAPAKFIIENISQNNLLPQKQNIETQTSQITKNLSALTSERDAITQKYNATLSSLNQRLNSANKELSEKEKQLAVFLFTTPEAEAEVRARVDELRRQIFAVRKSIGAENLSYQQKLNNYNTQIKNTQKNLDNLAEQDVNLEADVETVQGSVSLEWISLYGITQLYLPEYWLTYALILAAIGAYLFKGRRKNEIAV